MSNNTYVLIMVSKLQACRIILQASWRWYRVEISESKAKAGGAVVAARSIR
jgi:hypothetical protein